MKRRGSVLIYVMILMVIVTVVVVTYADLTTASVSSENLRENNYATKVASDAAVVAVQDAFNSGTLTNTNLPSTKTYTLPNESVTVVATDNGSNLARTMLLTTTVTGKGGSRTSTKIVGKRYSTVVPNWYALYCAQDYASSKNTVTTSSTRDAAVYIGGNLSGSGSLTVAGDLDVAGSVTGSGTLTVSGKTTSAASAHAAPSVSASDYGSLLGALLQLLGTLVNIDFTLNSLIYANLSLNLSGVVTGIGTLYANTLTVNANLTYANSSAAIGVVVNGNITVPSSVTVLNGFYYCTGSFKTSGPVTINGSLACNQVTLGGDLTINYDSRIWSNESLANTLKLPGAYP